MKWKRFDMAYMYIQYNMGYIIVFNFYSFPNFTLGIRSLKKQKSKLIMIFQNLGDFLHSNLNLRYSFEFSERFAKPFRGTANIRNLVLLRSALINSHQAYVILM